jgi:hypothetical protein
MNKFSMLALGLSVSTLSACTMMDDYPDYQPYIYDKTSYYSQDNGRSDFYYNTQSYGGVQVPDSYHLGAFRAPTKAKDVDKTWVSSQNPQGYTIEVADDQKASRVAGKLQQLPKNDRMAEIKYQRNGSPYYKGLYGSYSSKEEAQKAYDALPPEVKQGAGIKNWSNVQSNVSD